MSYEPIITPHIFSGFPVKAFFTTKTLDSLEFGVESAELKGKVSKLLNISPKNIYLPIQKHTDKVLIVDYDVEPKIADAVITNREDILIGVQVADCVPILLYDMQKNVVGAVHAGWRGTAEEILKKTIKAMMDRFCSIPSDIVIAIGPGIRWCCYGVGYEVIEAVEKVTSYGDCPRFTDADRRPLTCHCEGRSSEAISSVRGRLRIGTVPAPKSKNYIIKKGEKYCLDLPTANKYQALSLGVPLENIWMSDECTFCLPEKYYSYRYAKGTTGRQCGFIGIVT
ncbi:MAG: peptidoglycan editing factor PgeF [Nitrospirota bacterium]